MKTFDFKGDTSSDLRTQNVLTIKVSTSKIECILQTPTGEWVVLTVSGRKYYMTNEEYQSNCWQLVEETRKSSGLDWVDKLVILRREGLLDKQGEHDE